MAAAFVPDSVPVDDLQCIIAALTGATKPERIKAARAAYDAAGYLLDEFIGQATAVSVVKPKRLSKKQIAEELQNLLDLPAGEVSAKAFPMWLIPILLNLAAKWLANRK